MCLCDCNLTLFVFCRDDTLQSVHDGHNEPFSSVTAQVRPRSHIVGRNQYGAEFGLGPLINGLIYPVFQVFFIWPVTVLVVTVAMPAAAVAAVAEA